MRLMLCTSAAGAALLLGQAGHAQDSRFAAGLGVGTTGIEAQAALGLNDRLSLRASGNFLDFDREQEFDDIEYDAQLEASTVAGFLDVRPFANAFTLTGGAYFGAREAAIEGAPTGPVEIGGTTFTPAEVGALVGDVDLGDFAPYAGIGFDNTFTSDSRVGFRLSAGVAFGEDPEVSLASVGGSFSGDAMLQAELDEEEENIANDADILKYYPVVSAGFFVKF